MFGRKQKSDQYDNMMLKYKRRTVQDSKSEIVERQSYFIDDFIEIHTKVINNLDSRKTTKMVYEPLKPQDESLNIPKL
jgi:hypothetical protein